MKILGNCILLIYENLTTNSGKPYEILKIGPQNQRRSKTADVTIVLLIHSTVSGTGIQTSGDGMGMTAAGTGTKWENFAGIGWVWGLQPRDGDVNVSPCSSLVWRLSNLGDYLDYQSSQMRLVSVVSAVQLPLMGRLWRFVQQRRPRAPSPSLWHQMHPLHQGPHKGSMAVVICVANQR